MEATSAYEAMGKMVQEKKLSKKINYDVLKDLNPSAFKTDAAEFLQVRRVWKLAAISLGNAHLTCWLDHLFSDPALYGMKNYACCSYSYGLPEPQEV